MAPNRDGRDASPRRPSREVGGLGDPALPIIVSAIFHGIRIPEAISQRWNRIVYWRRGSLAVKVGRADWSGGRRARSYRKRKNKSVRKTPAPKLNKIIRAIQRYALSDFCGA